MKYKILFINFLIAHACIHTKSFRKYKNYIEIDSQDLIQDNNFDDSKVIIVTEQNYDIEVNQSKQPVVILASTNWCRPCKFFKIIYAKVAEECSDMFKFVRIDFDSYKNFFVKHDIRTVPGILFSVNGEIVEKHSVFLSKDNFKRMICSTHQRLKDTYNF